MFHRIGLPLVFVFLTLGLLSAQTDFDAAQNVLAEQEWMGRMAEEDFRALSPLIHNHVNPYGTFELDMAKRLPLDAPVELVVQ